MEDRILRKLFLGFIQIHILHHAKEEPIYGSWMLEELAEHGYELSAGILYPLLHSMELSGFLEREEKNVEGRIRKYYSTTEKGNTALQKQKRKPTNFSKK